MLNNFAKNFTTQSTDICLGYQHLLTLLLKAKKIVYEQQVKTHIETLIYLSPKHSKEMSNLNSLIYLSPKHSKEMSNLNS